MIKKLIAIANSLDAKGLQKEASYLDHLIKTAVFSGDKRTDKDLRPSTIYRDEILADKQEAEDKAIKDYDYDDTYDDHDTYDDYDWFEERDQYSFADVMKQELSRNRYNLEQSFSDKDINDKEWIDSFVILLSKRKDLIEDSRKEAEKNLPMEGNLVHYETPEIDREAEQYLSWNNPGVSRLLEKYHKASLKQ